VTIPMAGATGEVSDQAIVHVSTPSTIDNSCYFGPNGSLSGNAVTAIKIGSATP